MVRAASIFRTGRNISVNKADKNKAMKSLLFSLMAMMAILTVQASEMPYTYLTFETTDGAKASVEMSSLKLTFSGTTLTIDTETYPISNLRKIYFSATDETNTTAIDALAGSYQPTEALGIYDLQGHRVSKSDMKRGIYIMKNKDKTYKMVFK